MLIPPERLPNDVLDALIEEFVTREGTDYGSVEYLLADKVKHVRQQLMRGDIVISFNQETESCTLIGDKEAITVLRGEQQ